MKKFFKNSLLKNKPVELTYKYYQNNTVIVCFLRAEWLQNNIYDFFNVINSDKQIEARVQVIDQNYKTNPHMFFKGVACLKEQDESNIELAKQIAKKKAYRSYYKYLLSLYKDVYEKLYHIIKEKLMCIEDIKTEIKHLDGSIQRLIYQGEDE